MTTAVADPLESYRLKDRQAAARDGARKAVEDHDAALKSLLAAEDDPAIDPDELTILRDAVEGCRAEMDNWKLYIARGWPRKGDRKRVRR